MKLRIASVAMIVLAFGLVFDLLVRSPSEELDLLQDDWTASENLAAAIAKHVDTARVPVEFVQGSSRVTVDRESNLDVFDLLEDVQFGGHHIVQQTVDHSGEGAKLVLRAQQNNAEWSVFADLTHKSDGWLIRKIRIHQS